MTNYEFYEFIKDKSLRIFVVHFNDFSSELNDFVRQYQLEKKKYFKIFFKLSSLVLNSNLLNNKP